MPEAAQSNDVEDVLSSIRRLVSENAKAAQGRSALVLTDDHRIAQPEDTSAPAAPAFPKMVQPSPPLTAAPAATRSIPPAPPIADTMGQQEAAYAAPKKSLIEESVQDAVLEEALTALDESFSTAEAGWHDVTPEEVQSFPHTQEVQAEEQTVDTDDLREVVADIVRQELRGELGERITRNVRKLVRREIQRALTAQSID
ncbi:MAG: hypothetical protein ACWA40_00840 [Planktomarina sp.]